MKNVMSLEEEAEVVAFLHNTKSGEPIRINLD